MESDTDAATGGWGSCVMRSSIIGTLHHSIFIIKMMKSSRVRWTEHIPRMGYVRYAYKIVIGKPEGKRPQGRLRLIWKYPFITLNVRSIISLCI